MHAAYSTMCTTHSCCSYSPIPTKQSASKLLIATLLTAQFSLLRHAMLRTLVLSVMMEHTRVFLCTSQCICSTRAQNNWGQPEAKWPELCKLALFTSRTKLKWEDAHEWQIAVFVIDIIFNTFQNMVYVVIYQSVFINFFRHCSVRMTRFVRR